MKRTVLPLVALLAAVVLLAGSFTLGRGAHDAAALTNCETSTGDVSPAEQQMLTLFNQARAQEGKAALSFSVSLNRAAAWHSEDQARRGVLSHDDSAGRDPFHRMPDCGYPSSGSGEIVAVGSPDVTTIFNLWMNSPGHRQAIMLANARGVGIGYASGYWTADFGSVVESGDPAPSSSAASTSTPTRTPTATPTVTPTPAGPIRRLTIAMLVTE